MNNLSRSSALTRTRSTWTGHARRCTRDDDSHSQPMGTTINRIKLYSESLAHTASRRSLPDVRSRAAAEGLPDCAIYGGTYMLDKPVDEIVMENGVADGASGPAPSGQVQNRSTATPPTCPTCSSLARWFSLHLSAGLSDCQHQGRPSFPDHHHRRSRSTGTRTSLARVVHAPGGGSRAGSWPWCPPLWRRTTPSRRSRPDSTCSDPSNKSS